MDLGLPHRCLIFIGNHNIACLARRSVVERGREREGGGGREKERGRVGGREGRGRRRGGRAGGRRGREKERGRA